jgi:hypothetical protein
MYAVANAAASLKLIWLIMSHFGETRESPYALADDGGGASSMRARRNLDIRYALDRPATGNCRTSKTSPERDGERRILTHRFGERPRLD